MPESVDQQRARIRADLRNSLPNSYFTLISLIQGTALGFLGTVVAEGHGAWGVGQWLSAVTTFLIVVQVWNEYRMSVTVWAGIPVLQDSVIPFTLGASEFWLIFAIPSTANWLLALTFVSLGGVIAYTHVQRLRDLPENHEMRVHQPYMRGQLVWSLGYGIVFAALWAGARANLFAAAPWLPTALATALVAALLLRAESHWRRVLRVVARWDEETVTP